MRNFLVTISACIFSLIPFGILICILYFLENIVRHFGISVPLSYFLLGVSWGIYRKKMWEKIQGYWRYVWDIASTKL
jgi:hypothetical protein